MFIEIRGKIKEKLSDEAAVEHIQENPYMQAFCGFDSFNTKTLFDRSSLSKIKKRLGEEYFKKMGKAILKILKKHKLINCRGVIVDVTVFPSAIRCPTNSWPLNEVRMWLEKDIKAACMRIPG